MTARQIDFPDAEAPGFDPKEPFVASNGNTYTYNGWGWELACEKEQSANISLMRVSQGNKAVWLGTKQDPPEADPDGKVGWYYRNPGVDSRKAHWTLWSQETNAHKHITLGDLKSLSLLIQGTSQLPFLQVYTKRQNDGQDASATYRSRLTYQPPANPGGLQSEVFVTTNLETELYANVNRLEFEREEWNDKGPLGDDEQISKIVVGTNSSSPEGTYEFLLQAMVIETAIGTFEMQVEITSDLPPQMVFYGTAPPDEAVEGALFTDEDTLKQFVHTGDGTWAEVTHWTGDGEAPELGKLTAVNITGYRTVIYQGTPFSERTLFSSVNWETQQGIHFDDEITVEVDMENNGNWQDIHLMDDAQLAANDIEIRFNKATGGAAFAFDWKGTTEGPWDPQVNFPCAQLRVTIKNQNLENEKDFTIKTSEPMFVFPQYKQDPAQETPTPKHPGASC